MWPHVGAYMYMHVFGEHLAATHLTKIVDRSRHIILIRRFEDVLVSYYFEILYREGFGEIDIDGAMARTWSEARRAGMLATLGALERLPIGKRWHNRITSARKDRSLMLLFRICVDVFFEHYRYWLEQDGQKLVLRYEDLRADPIGNLRRLVDFVGRVPSVDLAQAVDRASFERMRKLELSGEGIRGVLRDGFWLPNLTTLNKDNPEAFKTREGKIGGQSIDRNPKRERHPNEDHENLVALGEADDFRAADHGVGDDESAREPDGEIQIPAEQ